MQREAEPLARSRLAAEAFGIASDVLQSRLDDGQPALTDRSVGTSHTAALLVSLRYFREQAGHPLWPVWDHPNVRRARVVQAFRACYPDDFASTWLPSYAPELDPEEQCNHWVQHDVLHALPGSIAELRRLVQGRFQRLQQPPRCSPNSLRMPGCPLTGFPEAHHANLVAARLYARLGEPQRAPAAVRQVAYPRGWPRYLAASLEEEARVGLAAGDATTAAAAAERLLPLRTQTEPLDRAGGK